METEQRLGSLVEALRPIMRDKRFQSLLVSEGLATIPKSVAERLQGEKIKPGAAAHASKPFLGKNAGRQPVSGICPDVLDFLQDYPVKVKIFGLLRHVLPARQLEIARLMVAMERVTFTYAKILIAFTPHPLLAEGFYPAMIANVSEDQLGAMTPELGRLSSEFLSAVERLGPVSLELLAAGRYLDRLMDNSRVVRYLAHTFPGYFEEFHELSGGHAFSNSLSLATGRGPRSGPPPSQIGHKSARSTELNKASLPYRLISPSGFRIHLIVRETEDEAWAAADRLISHVSDDLIAEAQNGFTNISESVGQKRMAALHQGRRDRLVVGLSLISGQGRGWCLVAREQRWSACRQCCRANSRASGDRHRNDYRFWLSASGGSVQCCRTAFSQTWAEG